MSLKKHLQKRSNVINIHIVSVVYVLSCVRPPLLLSTPNSPVRASTTLCYLRCPLSGKSLSPLSRFRAKFRVHPTGCVILFPNKRIRDIVQSWNGIRAKIFPFNAKVCPFRAKIYRLLSKGLPYSAKFHGKRLHCIQITNPCHIWAEAFVNSWLGRETLSAGEAMRMHRLDLMSTTEDPDGSDRNR